MPVTTSTIRVADEEPGVEDKVGGRSYEVKFIVTQTDAGSRAAGVAVVIAAQTAGQIPLKGDEYSFDGTTDLDSFLQEISWKRLNPADHERRYEVTCRYTPAEDTNPEQLGEPDPLLWPTEYWIEWVEEQVVLEEARNVEEFLFILRNPNTLGAVTNACGQEFTEPLMKTIYYPVLHAQKNYATLNEIIALNLSFQGTTNNATYFGSPIRTAKYLTTESGRIQKISGQSFYAGVTRIWFKDSTWDRKVLNNGWNHFKYEPPGTTTILYDDNGNPVLFKNKVCDQTAAQVDADNSDVEDVPSSEPLNLTLDGTLLPADDAAVYVTYRDLAEVNYAGIGIGG